MMRTVWTGPLSRRGPVWGMIVLIGIAILLGTCPAPDLAAKDEATPKTLPTDLALIPGNSFDFVTIRVADLWNDEAIKNLRTQLAKQEPDIFKPMENNSPVPLGE